MMPCAKNRPRRAAFETGKRKLQKLSTTSKADDCKATSTVKETVALVFFFSYIVSLLLPVGLCFLYLHPWWNVVL